MTLFGRMLRGAWKAAAVGALFGAVFHFALGWTRVPLGLGALLSMGVVATVGALCGRPPWRQAAALEGVLKAGFGLALGGVGHWLLHRYASPPLPFDLVGSPAGTPWTETPLLFCAAVAVPYGMLVELDHDDDAPRAEPRRRAAAEETYRFSTRRSSKRPPAPNA